MDVDPSRLDRRRRIALAQISGLGQRLAFNPDCAHVTLAEAVAELHAITRDPVLYGMALGAAQAELDEWPGRSRDLVTLYRAAGADEQVATASLAWQRERRERQQNSEGRPML